MTLYTHTEKVTAPATDAEILAAAEAIIKRVVPPAPNATEMIKQAVQDRTLIDPPPPFEKPPRWGEPTMLEWLRTAAENCRAPHGFQELRALRLDCAADHIELLSGKVHQLHRKLEHALHAVTAAQNGLSNLQEGRFPLEDIPIMLDRVRELEKLALGDGTDGSPTSPSSSLPR